MRSIIRFIHIIYQLSRYGMIGLLASHISFCRINKIYHTLFFFRRHSEPGALRLRLCLEKLGPIFIKFGQVLSTRRDLFPADYADELAMLQDKVPPTPFDAVQKVVSDSFGRDLSDVFAEFSPTPIGSASIAQVHRATLHDGVAVAVKVLHPDIARIVTREITLMRAFSSLLQAILPHGSRFKIREVTEQFVRHLQAEVNLKQEASNCSQIRRNFEQFPKLRVPEVYWHFCTREVMTMEFIEGFRILDIAQLNEAGLDRDQLAHLGIEIFFTQVFAHNCFHADMHPGNIRVDAGGRIILFDFGIVGQLSDFDKDYIARNFLAFFRRDYRAVARMHVIAGWVPAETDIQAFEAAIRAICEPVFSQPLKDISFGRLLVDMFRVAQSFQLSVQPQLVLLQKTLLNVEGIGRQLSPETNLWETAHPILEKWSKRQYHPRRLAQIGREQYPDLLLIAERLPMIGQRLLAPRQESPPKRPIVAIGVSFFIGVIVTALYFG